MGDWTSKLSGLFVCVNGADGRCSIVALSCYFFKWDMTMSMTSYGLVCIVLIFGFVSAVALDYRLISRPWE